MPQGEHEWLYLDLKPETFTDLREVPHVRRAFRRQGAKRVFLREIFGVIDAKGLPAVEYFDQFTHSPVAGDTAFRDGPPSASGQNIEHEIAVLAHDLADGEAIDRLRRDMEMFNWTDRVQLDRRRRRL